MGLRDGPLKPRGPVYYFRIGRGGRSFETATFGHADINEAYDAMRKAYRGCQVAAVNPEAMAEDGLPWFPGCESRRVSVE
jgi:hypothetical protein